MSKQTPPAPTASAVGPCPTIIQIVGRPGTGSLPRTIAPPDHPLFISKEDLSHTDFMSELFKDQGFELVTWSKLRDFFLNKYCLTNYFDSILLHITIVLYAKRETENNGM